jgi:coenzyme F420-0:L-glutamate ligase/coenzyme F420-1:gamma-L-glutamate ligase
MPSSELRVIGIAGIPEVHPGDDLAALILDAAARQGFEIATGDVLVVTQKIVSKAEGRLVRLSSVEPSDFARRLAADTGKDARHVEVVLDESRRIVRMDRGVLITETRHGFVCANSGVDASNTGAPDLLALLPEDPDRSAEKLRRAVEERTGAAIAVVISDTFGRPWREGTDQVAIGVAGLLPLKDYAGQKDAYGYELRVTQVAVADELAGAAELVMGKLERIPVAVIRGYSYESGRASARDLIRDREKDLFR